MPSPRPSRPHPLYSFRPARGIVRALGIGSSERPAELLRQVENAAATYLHVRRFDEHALKPAELKRAFLRAAQDPAASKDLLENLRPHLDVLRPFAERFGGLDRILEEPDRHRDELTALAAEASQISAPPGRLSDRALDFFILTLADLYQTYSGRKPGVSQTWRGYQGPFFSFVAACLVPLVGGHNIHSQAALGRRISRVLVQRSDS